MRRYTLTSIISLTSAIFFILFLGVLVPALVSAETVPATEYCSSFRSISGLSGATVKVGEDECELEVEGKDRGLTVSAQIVDFTADPAGVETKYAEYERGADVLLVACNDADHPCDVKTQTTGSLKTNVVTYNIPDEEDQSIFFNWGGGELAAAVDQYRGHVYSIFVVQGDSDGKVNHPRIHSDIIAKTKEIIDARASDTSNATEDGAGPGRTSNGGSSDKDSKGEEKDAEEADKDESPKTLKVIGVGEDVEIRSEGGDWREADSGMELKDGDEISTGPDSVLTLQFPDGTIMQVSELTQVRVGFLLSEENALRAEIQLKLGKVAARVNPKKTSFTDFTIKSPIATASVRGTTFGVIYHSNTGMRVMVEEGTVNVAANDGTSQDVSGGYDVRVTDEGFGEQYPFDGTLFEGDIPAAAGTGGEGGGFNSMLLIGLGIVAGIVLVLVMRRKRQ